jgi:1-acyl-sn-glycerol-3-phosphate acyltransferase
MRTLRLVSRLTIFVLASFVCLGDFVRKRICRNLSTSERAAWLQYWCSLGLRIIGTSAHVQGEVPRSGLIVSNHLSYLDILVYSTVAGCAFVSKREVRSWPVFGWIATLAGSIYIDRRRPGDTHRVSNEMAAALANDHPLVLFPEGTSSDGSSVLRFHSSLFEAAVATQTPITSAYLYYEVTDGSVATDVCYWGKMSFARHILRLFAIRHVSARIRFAPAAQVFDDRKMAAAATHAEVVSLSDRSAATQHSSL